MTNKEDLILAAHVHALASSIQREALQAHLLIWERINPKPSVPDASTLTTDGMDSLVKVQNNLAHWEAKRYQEQQGWNRNHTKTHFAHAALAEIKEIADAIK